MLLQRRTIKIEVYNSLKKINMKYKVGDTVKILKSSLWYNNGPFNPKDEVGKIISFNLSDNMGLPIEVEWEKAGKNEYAAQDLELVTKTNKKQPIMSIKTAMQAEVLRVAKELAVANNTFTTLEIKTKLIKEVPEVKWTQAFISDTMLEYEQEGKFTFTDNGTYRTYSLVKLLTKTVKSGPALRVSVSKPKAVSATKKGFTKIKRLKAQEMILNSKKTFITVEFINKEGELRKLNGQCTGKSPNGVNYLLFTEASKLKSGVNAMRNVNINTLLTFSMKGTKYAVK